MMKITGFVFIDDTLNGLQDMVGSAKNIRELIAEGDEQSKVRDLAIETIDRMCDALQHASDIVSNEITSSISEFHRLEDDDPEAFYGYFERLSNALSEPALRHLLHQGQVCGELHKLSDRFKQPFSKESPSSLSFWENIKTIFLRSNKMKKALNGLKQGERHYLRDITAILNDAREAAQSAGRIVYNTNDKKGTAQTLRKEGEQIVKSLREKRRFLADKFNEIRDAGDAAIDSLH